jgi:cytochrome c oxidase subunit 2
MKVRTGNPNFVYEISCDQMCGKNHFSMRGVIIVESEEEYRRYLATLEPAYYTVFPDKKPKPANAPGTVADSLKIVPPVTTAAITSAVN